MNRPLPAHFYQVAGVIRLLPALFPWLAVAGLADWLAARTFARAAIFMPKTPVMRFFYQAMVAAGQWAGSLAGLLALAALGWIAWSYFRRERGRAVALAWGGLLLAGLLGLFVPTAGWLGLSFQALSCTVLLGLTGQAWRRAGRLDEKIAVSISGLALLASRLYLGLDAAAAVLERSAPPGWSGALYRGGELLVLLSVAALWWALARRAEARIWLVAALPALAFAAPRLLAPAMTGILAIWSTGLTLYLPWPAYALALWLAGVTVIHTLRRGDPAGWALLLLAAGGFAPQMSVQAFMGVIALWLLVDATSHAPGAGQFEPGLAPVFAGQEV